MPKENKLFSIPGVEIFAAGKWNGDEYTIEDLQCMCDAFEETKRGLPPHLKLGHDDNQKMLQKDGMPAAGWIEKMYIKGDKLVADFCDIPKKIYDLIQQKAYKKVSSEIYWNLKVGDKTYKKVLASVALLGADMPAVQNLSDILGMYSKKENEELKIYEAMNLNIKESEAVMEKTEKELALEAQVEEQKKQYAQAQEKIAELEKFKAEADAKAEELRIEKFTSDLVVEKLCTPAMKPMLAELVGPEKKEYSLQDKKLSKEELLKETLKLFKASLEVNLEEGSSKGEKNSKTDEKAIDQKVRQYMTEHKVTYGQALKVISKENKGE